MLPSNQPAPQTSMTDDIKEWWRNVPAINKGIMSICTLIYLISFVNTLVIFLFVNIPYYTIFGFQVFRLFTATFVHRQLLQLIFSFMSLIPQTIQLEKQLGSVAFCIDFLVKGIEIQILFTLVTFVISFAEPAVLSIPSCGLWNLVLTYLTIRCNQNPEAKSNFLCFPVQIKNKYYPIAILAFICLLFQPQLDLIVAALVGYLEFRYFNGMTVQLNQQKASKYEQGFFFRCINARPDFVSHVGVSSFTYDFNASPQQTNQQSNNPSNSDRAYNLPRPGNLTSPFSGKGTSIGQGTLNNQQNVQQNQPQRQGTQQKPDTKQSQQQSQPQQSFKGKGVSIGGQDSDMPQQSQNKGKDDYVRLNEEQKDNEKSQNIEMI